MTACSDCTQHNSYVLLRDGPLEKLWGGGDEFPNSTDFVFV